MLDPKFIRENIDLVKRSLKDRKDDVNKADKFLELDGERRSIITVCWSYLPAGE